MKTEIIARETIKPSSPTPKSYNLCVMDQDSPPIYVKLYFFYENTCTGNFEEVVAKMSKCLKSSLSKVLTRFYPFAGKIRDQMTVSLEEDDGAEFLEARVDSTLSEYLVKPFPEMFLNLVPDDYWDLGKRNLLVVQASFFKCGGLAIGMNFSHKVSDATTFTSFINAWAETAKGNSHKVENSDFSGSLVFPAMNGLFLKGEDLREIVKINNKTMRFVFIAPRIAALQEKTKSETMQRATRVETISTFIWRIGMKTFIKRAGGSLVPSVLIMPVNMRGKLQLPICDQTFGNLVELEIVSNESCDIELSYLVSLLKEKMKKTREAYEENLDGKRFLERFFKNGEKMREFVSQPDVTKGFTISSWSNLPLYEADFGWGKPIWVATHNPVPYIMFLMDTRDGTGIEAWVNFPEDEMASFARDEELLTYAIPDPSAL